MASSRGQDRVIRRKRSAKSALEKWSAELSDDERDRAQADLLSAMAAVEEHRAAWCHRARYWPKAKRAADKAVRDRLGRAHIRRAREAAENPPRPATTLSDRSLKMLAGRQGCTRPDRALAGITGYAVCTAIRERDWLRGGYYRKERAQALVLRDEAGKPVAVCAFASAERETAEKLLATLFEIDANRRRRAGR